MSRAPVRLRAGQARSRPAIIFAFPRRAPRARLPHDCGGKGECGGKIRNCNRDRRRCSRL